MEKKQTSKMRTYHALFIKKIEWLLNNLKSGTWQNANIYKQDEHNFVISFIDDAIKQTYVDKESDRIERIRQSHKDFKERGPKVGFDHKKGMMMREKDFTDQKELEAFRLVVAEQNRRRIESLSPQFKARKLAQKHA